MLFRSTFSARPHVTVWSIGAAWNSKISDNWNVQVRAGLHVWADEWTNVGSISSIPKADGSDMYYGVNLGYNVNARWSFGVGINRYAADNSFSTYSVSTALHF